MITASSLARPSTPDPVERVSRYFEAFLEMLVAERGASQNTVESYQRDLSDCAAFLADEDAWARHLLDGADSAQLRAYLKHLDARGMAPSTAA